MFDVDEYQKAALRTAPRDPNAYRIPDGITAAIKDFIDDPAEQEEILLPLLKRQDQMIWSLGLAGEAGEFADMMKKHHGHGHDLDREKAAKELGDVLWYVAVLADSIDFKLSTIMEMNVQKLKKRYPQGFTIEASKNRE